MNNEPRQFTRVFRIFERLFPGSQLGFPNLVHPTLQMIADVMRPSFLHDSRLMTDAQSSGTGAGGDIDLNHAEPDAGFVHVPVCHHVSYSGAANIQGVARLFSTSSALDPWGRWTATNIDFVTLRGANGDVILVPCFPYSRGNQIRFSWLATAAAQTVTSTLLFISVPGELAHLETWSIRFGNYVTNRALP